MHKKFSDRLDLDMLVLLLHARARTRVHRPIKSETFLPNKSTLLYLLATSN